MQDAEGMTNVQNIPTSNTDFDLEVTREENKKPQVPADKQPYIAPVSEPPTSKRSIKEDTTEPPHIMARAAMFDRRIY